MSDDKSLQFDRQFLNSPRRFSYIGKGSSGGKAKGLEFIHKIITEKISPDQFPNIETDIPRFTVIRSQVFDRFMQQNNLYDIACSDIADDRIAHAFQKAEMPFEVLGDLRALIEAVRQPLAIRSSSILEDALNEPFAGVYTTKMIPNNQHDADSRFRKLLEAIKLVYASTFFKNAKSYMRATTHNIKDEKMAVIIQEVVGYRYKDCFYPHISGVARTYNYYAMGRANPQDGVINLAFGLGKTIVDGGICWSYSPHFPNIGPPFASVSDMLKLTQTQFWSVNMGKAPDYNPLRETEYMLQKNIADAEEDKTLRYVASTVDRNSGRVTMGTGVDGPRIINFAPVLELDDIPLNSVLKILLQTCQDAYDMAVEIEFAVTISEEKTRLGFLQVRPMVVPDEEVDISSEAFSADKMLLSSKSTLGNGIVDSIHDIIYVIPDKFEARYTKQTALELEQLNKEINHDTPYLLIGFGRWGSSDPWLGIPVEWGQISGAKAIVEAAIDKMNVELSQGAHFFHNISGFRVSYFSVPFAERDKIDWAWLNKQKVIRELSRVRHVKSDKALKIMVDGRSGRGVILKEA